MCITEESDVPVSIVVSINLNVAWPPTFENWKEKSRDHTIVPNLHTLTTPSERKPSNWFPPYEENRKSWSKIPLSFFLISNISCWLELDLEIPSCSLLNEIHIQLFKGVAERGSRTKGRRGGVRPKAEKKKWPQSIQRWKRSAMCLLQLRMILVEFEPRDSSSCVLVKMPTLRAATQNSSGVPRMTTHPKLTVKT